MREVIKDFQKLNISKSSFPYWMVYDTLKGKRVHTVIRSGMYGKTDYTAEVVEIMYNMGIDCIIGSDAPRGGKIGTYVELAEGSIRRYTIKKIIGNQTLKKTPCTHK